MNEKVALVTGGGTGIGAAVCRQLLADGYRVVSLSRRKGDAAAQGVISVQVDLTDPAATRQVAQDVASRYPINTVIHNAGAVRERRLEDVTIADLEALSNLHLGAAIALVQASLPTMKAQHYGRIVLISTRAVVGLAKRTVYSATKAGMLGMSRTWALELAPFGVTSNVVAPGPIAETELFHEIVPADSPKLGAIAATIPVGRLGKPDDVARAVMFFVAPQADFITGQTLFVCGGTSVGGVTY